MRRTDTSDWPCNIARGANVLADLWNVLIVREACLGTHRYEDFQRSLGIGRNILTIRLNGLVNEGLLERVEYQSNPVRHEYRLTHKGRDAYTVLAAMAAWAERWLVGPEGTPASSTTRPAVTTCAPPSSAASAGSPSTCAKSKPAGDLGSSSMPEPGNERGCLWWQKVAVCVVRRARLEVLSHLDDGVSRSC
jgi:DNA-binding HxlR family transcriptional regulator